MKFGTQTKENMLSPKNAKPGVCRHFSRWLPSSRNLLDCSYLAIYHLILMKFGTQTRWTMLNQKTQNRKRSAIFQDGRRCHLENHQNASHLSPDFDETWCTDYVEHAEFKKRQTGSVPPFFRYISTGFVATVYALLSLYVTAKLCTC
jgi:hypothetical protein